MNRLPALLFIALAALLAAPALATCPSNPASVVCTGVPVAIPDGAYDGTIGSMACATCTYTIDPGCPDVLKAPPVFEIGVTQTFVGDLTIKVVNPAAGGSIVKRIQSRAGLVEPADDGTDCCGFSEDWLGDVITYTDVGTGNTPAELMGINGGPICTGGGGGGDGVCIHDADQGVGAPGSDDDLSAYVGGPAAGGVWLVCVGDSIATFPGTLDSATIIFEQLPVALQSFAIE